MNSSITILFLLASILAITFAYDGFEAHPKNLQWRDNEGIRVKRGWGYGGGYPGGYGGGYPGGYGGGYPGGYGGFGGPQYGGGSYGSSSWGSYSSSRSGGFSNYNSGFYGK